MTITDDTSATLLADLVRVESVTPWLIPTGSGERAVADFMAAWLSDLPVEVTFDEIEPGRVNLIARLRGTGGGPVLGINAHADTVGYANWADRALNPAMEGDRMVGLGVADDKSGCAAGLLALRSLVESGVRLAGRRAARVRGRRGGRLDRLGGPGEAPHDGRVHRDRAGRAPERDRRASGVRMDRRDRARRRRARIGAGEGRRRDRAHGRGRATDGSHRPRRVLEDRGQPQRQDRVPHRHARRPGRTTPRTRRARCSASRSARSRASI